MKILIKLSCNKPVTLRQRLEQNLTFTAGWGKRNVSLHDYVKRALIIT
jgi:hypothetical protein